MNSVDEILDFAIEREQAAADFYSSLAERANSAWMKDMLLSFSKEEMRHKGKLKSVKKGEKLLSSEQQVLDLKIADYLVDVEPQGDISLQDAMIVAMKREKAAYRLYSDLAAKSGRCGAERAVSRPGPGRGQTQTLFRDPVRRSDHAGQLIRRGSKIPPAL